MTTSLAKILAELEAMNTAVLQVEWRRLFRSQPPSLSRDLLMRAIGYRYQELELGGVSRTAMRKLRSAGDAVAAKTLAERALGAPGKPQRRAASHRPTLLPGGRLVREWHGRTHVVTVTGAGFEFSGRPYRSLTEIAREITGTHWSGPRFFGLDATNMEVKRKSAAMQTVALLTSGEATARRARRG